METYVACGDCGTTYWTSVPPEAVSHIRRCMQCASPALEVVVTRPSAPAMRRALSRAQVDARARERSAKALERAKRARRRAHAARLLGKDRDADRHERAARLHMQTAEVHMNALAVPRA